MTCHQWRHQTVISTTSVSGSWWMYVLSCLLVLMEVYIVMITYVVMETCVDVHISFFRQYLFVVIWYFVSDIYIFIFYLSIFMGSRNTIVDESQPFHLLLLNSCIFPVACWQGCPPRLSSKQFLDTILLQHSISHSLKKLPPRQYLLKYASSRTDNLLQKKYCETLSENYIT